MLTVINKLNGPQAVETETGRVVIPPYGTVKIKGFAPGWEAAYVASPLIEITKARK